MLTEQPRANLDLIGVPLWPLGIVTRLPVVLGLRAGQAVLSVLPY